MANAREEILGRIAAALVDRPERRPVPRDYERRLDPGIDIVELFAERVADYRATVHRTTPERLAQTVAAVLAGLGVGRIVVPAGAPAAWLADAAVEQVRDDPPLSVTELDRIDATITGCAVAIAETGTIVLDGGPGQGRRALSLLPDRHICIVPVDLIVGTVPQALERLDPRRAQTWISGPSATSDIELQRVEGVHGPRILQVVLVGPSRAPVDRGLDTEDLEAGGGPGGAEHGQH